MSASPHSCRLFLQDNGAGIKGVVIFTQADASQPTQISAKLEGLKPGKHGFHIHEKGNLTQGCATAGGHFNPHGADHGGPNSKVRHVGGKCLLCSGRTEKARLHLTHYLFHSSDSSADLGNVVADASGVATYEASDALVQLSGDLGIIGRSVVVHADEDDLGQGGHADSKTTGHAGARIVCGVIGRDY